MSENQSRSMKSRRGGSPWAFSVADGAIVLRGPLFEFFRYLAVGAIVIHLKLDELIRSVQGARNAMANLEDLSGQELAQLRQEFQRPGIRSGAPKRLLREHLGDNDDGRRRTVLIARG